ncbi:MAG: cobalamin biosynthesis protein [Theionarchaea archaeon]|nr:cobalamin biosynthesis protein [Theionarchaea archaeon]
MIEIILTALAVDVLFGEPPGFIHPVRYIGTFVSIQKSFFDSRDHEMLWGCFIVFSTVSVTVMFVYCYLHLASTVPFILRILALSLLLKTTFSVRFLHQAASEVKIALEAGDLQKGREKVSEIVSRDTSDLSEKEVISAACESVAESITDSIISPLFYYSVLGLYGAAVYRGMNTLDSMVGYKSMRIGTLSARLDDVLNFIPSRLAAALVLLSGVVHGCDWRNGLKIFLRDRNKTESPNAGNTMAMMAGVLHVTFEKRGRYTLGHDSQALAPHHIADTLTVMKGSTLIFVVILLLVEVAIWKV